MGPGDLTDQPTPPAEEVVAEAQRRWQARYSRPPLQQRLLVALNRLVFWLSKHWAALFNTLIGLYLGGAVLAPVLMQVGLSAPAHRLYTFYGAFCHQYPFRSWFLFGKQVAYPLTTVIPLPEMAALRTFVGDPTTGYKIALCQRDVAIYGAMLLAGLLFAALRRVRRWPILPVELFLASMVPMLLDGGLQWLSYFVWWFIRPAWLPAPHETTSFLRTLTGAIFGVGSIAVAYPYLNDFFQDVHRLLAERYHWA